MAANEIIALRDGARAGRSSLDLEGRKPLTFRLIVLSKLISRQASRYLNKHYDLSVAEWSILTQLAEGSPRTLRQLAEITRTDKAQLIRANAALLKRGLVERELDPKDARSVLFLITPEGRELREEVQPTRREFNQTLMDQLSEEECRALGSGIDTLTNYLTDDFEVV